MNLTHSRKGKGHILNFEGTFLDRCELEDLIFRISLTLI
jgi:hypothetical protein